jgi:hypothetical protein
MVEKKKRIKELAAERLRAETGVCVRACVSVFVCSPGIHRNMFLYYIILYYIS